MVADIVGNCQPIPHFFLSTRSIRNRSLKRGTRRIVIGIQIRKCFEKLLQIFFFSFCLFGMLWISSTPTLGPSENRTM
jgi:hypothetical protein